MKMSQILEQFLDLLVNEETEKAEELLHNYVVKKARTIYEELVNEEDFALDMDSAGGDSLGGDEGEGFVSDVEADSDDIEAEELADGEIEGADPNSPEEMIAVISDKMEDMEGLLSSLSDALTGDDEGMEGDDYEGEMDMEVGGELDLPGDDEVEMPFESLDEATKLTDEQTVDMSKEGVASGEGKNFPAGNTVSPVAKDKKVDSPADAVDFTKGGDEKGGKGDSAKDETPSSNIDADHKEEKKDPLDGQDTEGQEVGKGKSKGKGNTKSILGNKK
jgi:hypothetical protein